MLHDTSMKNVHIKAKLLQCVGPAVFSNITNAEATCTRGKLTHEQGRENVYHACLLDMEIMSIFISDKMKAFEKITTDMH